ncbi:MAG TPA: flagellar hook-basal body complex protein FliE [Desulfobacteraceae bacterium]|nr:flagellar hook-basal body complex protein FliE [Desulfobacteraceae bacterium]
MMNRLTIDNRKTAKPLSVQNTDRIKDKGFGDTFNRAVKKVNDLLNNADNSIEQVVNGNLGIQEGMLNIWKADTSLRLLLQARNKALDAYKEIMRMQF